MQFNFLAYLIAKRKKKNARKVGKAGNLRERGISLPECYHCSYLWSFMNLDVSATSFVSRVE